MNITPISFNTQTKATNLNPNFKADFVFTKASARTFREEMKRHIYESPLKSLKGKNPLQILVKKIKEMYPGRKVKLYYEPSKYYGMSYINGSSVYSPAEWIADSGNKKLIDAGTHYSEGNVPSDTPIENLFRRIVENPKYFFGN